MTQEEMIQALRRTPIPMPRTAPLLFQLLSVYDPSAGLPSLLDRIDFAGVSAAQIRRAALDLPPPADAALSRDSDDILRGVLAEALQSKAFQQRVLPGYLHAFPHLRREVFIHVPKCAGTDLTMNVAPTRLSLPKRLEEAHWTSGDDLLAALAGLAQAAPHYQDIFVYGHIVLSEYVNRIGVRPGDSIFTIIREPADLMLSQANYTVGRLRQDPGLHDPDTRQTMQRLGLAALPDPLTPQVLKELAAQCLRNPAVAQPNRICFYLGRDRIETYAAAMRSIVDHDVEVTTTQHYRAWLKARWGIEPATHHNRSEAVITRREAQSHFAQSIAAGIAEDQKVFDVIAWALEQSGAPSIRGSQLATLAGERLWTTLPEELAQQRARAQQDLGTVARSNLVVAHNQRRVDIYRSPVGPGAGGTGTRVLLDVQFRLDGNAKGFIRQGWASPEPRFTWTTAHTATLVLPRPADPGRYALQFVVRPFVWKQALPQQRVTVLVNGAAVGSGKLNEIAVLECDLPWSLLAERAEIAVTLDLPDAARPNAVKGEGADSRLLALAVESLALLQFEAPLQAAPPPLPPAPAAAAELPAAELVTRFESIGENCEFGLVQRQCGAEPLGLLRFSSAPLPPLLKALRERFVGMGKLENMRIEVGEAGREYMVKDIRFGFLYHAWVVVGEKTPDEILAREAVRVPLLVRKLVEDLTDGDKIFVFHGMKPLQLEQAKALAALLRGYGPTTMLWVELADAEHPPGSVVWAGEGLLKAHIDRFAPGSNAHDLSLACWITLCRCALALHEAARQPAGKAAASA